MTSSKAPQSTRDILDDHRLTFNCYQFSRNVRSGRPLSRRQVTAKECLCTDDTQKICDPSRVYTIGFYESSDEEEAKHQQDVSEKNPDIPPDRIGAFQTRSRVQRLNLRTTPLSGCPVGCGAGSRWRASFNHSYCPTTKARRLGSIRGYT